MQVLFRKKLAMKSLPEQKLKLRKEIAAAVNLLSKDYLRMAGAAIGKRLAALPEYRVAGTVLAFASTANEPDIWPFLRRVLADGKHLALPVCTGPGLMEFRVVTELDTLASGRYGILEPPAESELVPPEAIDFAVIPCVTCNVAGDRLGHGGGYYDRFLAVYAGPAAAVCPKTLMREAIPIGPLDRPVPIVVTERDTYRRQKGEYAMKVLMLNGSPRVNGNTSVALAEMEKVFAEEGIEVETIQVGGRAIRGCMACNGCAKKGKCVFDDAVNEIAPKFEACDGLVVASPVYYASANATLVALLDRLFYSTPFDKTMKVGASVVVARRGGLSATFDELNKYFTISGMPVASSQYWNSVHGLAKGEAAQDGEGLQTMRTLARNMAFLMKCIALGREQYGLPKTEPRVATNFIH